MSWKFKASKYKNTAPLDPKFDKHIRELSIGSYHSCGNFIAASAAFIGFNWDTAGSSIAILPLTASGRPDKTNIPRIEGHTEMVTDFMFSPFDDGMVVTGSLDQTIMLWQIPSKDLYTNLTVPQLTLTSAHPKKIETVGFSPAVHGILSSSGGPSVSVWDLASGKEVFEWEGHEDKVQSVAWQLEGRCLATQSKDRVLRILDPRSGTPLVSQAPSHQGIKDSKVVWVGEDRLLTSGFGEDRARELILRDVRNLSTPQHVLSLDVSSGILIPLYDPDTNMVFLTGKGDRYIQFVEVQEQEPWFVAGLRYTGEQIKGGCLVPKRAVDVMQCEVNRVLMLGNNSIIPVTWQVPRKSYREYHADVYPDTQGTASTMGPQDWINGANRLPPKISLNPADRPESLVRFGSVLTGTSVLPVVSPKSTPTPTAGASSSPSELSPVPTATAAPSPAKFSTPPKVEERPAPEGSPKPSPKPRLSRTDSIEGPKPSPRPVSTSSNPSSRPLSSNLNPSPRPLSSNSSESSRPSSVKSDSSQGETGLLRGDDVTDEAPASTTGFRRQPSIRDKMKIFEQRGNNATAESKPEIRRPTFSKPREVSARREKELDLANYGDDDKENAPMEVEKESIKVRHTGETEDVVLRPKIRKDKNNPFVMSHMKPQYYEATAQNRASRFGRVTKFRHMKGTPLHKSKHFDNLKNLSKSVPAESEYIQANSEWLAIPLAGPGGKLAILETAKAGRISDGVMPAVINTATAMDFAWDPFNNRRLVVVTDEGTLNLWIIPEGGLFIQVNKPTLTLSAHSDKVSLVRFNPVAQDVVATAAFDWLIKIWNLGSQQEVLTLTGHTDQIYSMAWSQCGRFLATVCRDGKVRIYDPRSGSTPVREGGDIVAKKGARIIWALDGKFIIVSGFSRQSERQIMIYDTKDLNCIHTETMSVSPGMLIPYYDEDSSTLFLSGKGEVTMSTFEIAEDAPHMFPLSPYKAPNPSQGFGFLPQKNILDVKNVEFARAYRLSNTTIEPISFTVPRVKQSYFQDDLFPPTRVLWEPVCSAENWFQGTEGPLRWLSLQPEGMPALSGNSQPALVTTDRRSVEEKTMNFSNLSRDEVTKVNRDITKAVEEIMSAHDNLECDILEQDKMEGVDQKEWEE